MTTPDPTTGEYADLRARALAAATAVFDRHLDLMAPPPHVVEEAFDAADQVYTQHADAETERIVAETGWLGMDVVDGTVRMRLKHARDFAAAVVASFDQMTQVVGATNYTETEITITDPDPEKFRKYTFLVIKPDGKSPHQLREQADAERDQARAQLAGLHAEIANIYPGITAETPAAALAAVVARFREIAEENTAATAEVARLRSELAAARETAKTLSDQHHGVLRELNEARAQVAGLPAEPQDMRVQP